MGNIKLALAGNPNCGKTTMFNALTGTVQYVGNWPGVTVEKKEGRLKGHDNVTVTDLPGIYSLSPYTSEEVVSRDYLAGTEPSAVIDIVDATNIERNLYLTTQILELGKPVVLAMNMVDALKKNGDRIDVEKLSQKLGCPVFETVALNGTGIKEVAAAAVEIARDAKPVLPSPCFASDVEASISAIEALLPTWLAAHLRRWTAIKLLERDAVVLKSLGLSEAVLSQAESITAQIEKAKNDDIESIITNERYNYITSLLDGVLVKSGNTVTTSDKIDRIVTNRVLGIPIFLAVMWLVYYISVSTIGTFMTDWTNEKLIAGETALVTSYDDFMAGLPSDGGHGEEPPFSAVDGPMELSGGLGAFRTGLPGLYNRSAAKKASAENPVMVGTGVQGLVEAMLTNAEASDVLIDCIVNGIIGGVGTVLGFLPQMAVLFLLLSALEDIGYMVRIAFVMDRLFRHFGLSGKSFIPLLISSGCGVPGIMASRTIENENDRRMTIMTTTWIPCGAKLPVIALVAAVLAAKFTGGSGAWLAPLMYAVGVASVLVAAVILKKTKYFHGPAAPFVMELPQYHIPSARTVLLHTWERLKGFVIKAGTILFLACLVMWFLSNYGFAAGGFGLVESGDSLLAKIGGAIRYIFIPLGFGNKVGGWQAAASSLTGFTAKEAIAGTMGVLSGVAEELVEAAENAGSAEEAMGVAQAVSLWFPSGLAAFSFLMFNMLDSPCIAAISAMAHELKSRRWFWFAIAFQNIFAYVVTLIVFQIGSLVAALAHGKLVFADGFSMGGLAAAFLLLGAICFALVRKNPYAELDKKRAAGRLAA
ncbi:MAG: ferrous iron transporter B [Treponema sp.]|nr:ferrous iron transporter B [Treponema sp.]